MRGRSISEISIAVVFKKNLSNFTVVTNSWDRYNHNICGHWIHE
jgi:hypothetical protein